MYKQIIQAALIIGAAVMVALIAEGAMLFVAAPAPDSAHLAPRIEHVEPTGAITALRMLVTLVQMTVVATIVITVGQYTQHKRRLHKTPLNH